MIRGSGFALIDKVEVPVADGDVLFVRKGSSHRLRGPAAEGASPLELILVVDEPTLANGFREGDAAEARLRRSLTLEELNRIAERYGTTHRTLD